MSEQSIANVAMDGGCIGIELLVDAKDAGVVWWSFNRLNDRVRQGLADLVH